MAKNLYDGYRDLLGKAGLNLTTSDLRWLAVKAPYVFAAGDANLSDIAAGERVDNGLTAVLLSPTFSNGVFDAADPAAITPDSGQTIIAWVLYYASGVEATSTLILYNDDAPNLPLVTNGGTVTVAHSAGADKILNIRANAA